MFFHWIFSRLLGGSRLVEVHGVISARVLAGRRRGAEMTFGPTNQSIFPGAPLIRSNKALLTSVQEDGDTY